MKCLEVGSLRHSYSINAAIRDVTVKCTMIILLNPLLVLTPGVEGGGSSVCALVGCSRNWQLCFFKVVLFVNQNLSKFLHYCILLLWSNTIYTAHNSYAIRFHLSKTWIYQIFILFFVLGRAFFKSLLLQHFALAAKVFFCFFKTISNLTWTEK